MHRCTYCSAWARSSVSSTIKEDEGQTKHKTIKRKCIISNTIISIDSEACEYFEPVSCFFCNANGHYISFLGCLNRRLNPDHLNAFEKCASCRQFELEIKQIIEDFWINKVKIISPATYIKKHRPIKRREKKRVIKRRGKNRPKRIIKRRS